MLCPFDRREQRVEEPFARRVIGDVAARRGIARLAENGLRRLKEQPVALRGRGEISIQPEGFFRVRAVVFESETAVSEE